MSIKLRIFVPPFIVFLFGNFAIFQLGCFCLPLCTLISLPDGWKFSEAGLVAIVPDGKESIKNSIRRLERLGYIKRNKERAKDGKYVSQIEVFTERESTAGYPLPVSRNGKNIDDSFVVDNQSQYNIDNKRMNINKDNIKSINQSGDISEMDGRMDEINKYKEIIAENIKLTWLLEIASTHNQSEIDMVYEIYEVICDMVCFKREKVIIKQTEYPWDVVKSRFLKLKYEHIAEVLNRIVDADLQIKNMNNYIISTLFTIIIFVTYSIIRMVMDVKKVEMKKDILVGVVEVVLCGIILWAAWKWYGAAIFVAFPVAMLVVADGR